MEQVWNHAISMVSDYKEAVKFCGLGPSACEVSWKKSQAGAFKINIDGATADDGRWSSIRVVIRDSKGEVTVALCRVLPSCFSMDEIEALAIKAGILLARELDLHQVIVESNSLSVVQRILAKDFSGGLGHIVHGILGFLEDFSSWQVRHLKRDFNKVAHGLAHFAKCNNINQVWRGISPPPPGCEKPDSFGLCVVRLPFTLCCSLVSGFMNSFPYQKKKKKNIAQNGNFTNRDFGIVFG